VTDEIAKKQKAESRKQKAKGDLNLLVPALVPQTGGSWWLEI